MLEELLGSKCRTEILKRIFKPGNESVYLRGLVRQTGLSCPALLHELRQLVKLQIFTSESSGNMVRYSANHEHFLFHTLKELVLKTEGDEGVLRRAFQESPAQVVFLFGSIAKGTDTPHSDMDICVVGDMTLLEVSRITCKIAESISREINPYLVTREEWRNRLKKSDHFLKELVASPKIFLKGGENELATMAG